jgi:hypothetical protein
MRVIPASACWRDQAGQRQCALPSLMSVSLARRKPASTASSCVPCFTCMSYCFIWVLSGHLCPSFVSSRATFLSVTLCLGTPCLCMGSVLVLIARFASLGHRQILLGGTPLWNASGAASSISFSAARPPGLVARILLICGLISWISCLVTLSWPRGCARHCMLTLFTPRTSADFACRGFLTLSASCPLVLTLFVPLFARFLPAMSFWLALLLLMRPCLLVNVCLLLVWCPAVIKPGLSAHLVYQDEATSDTLHHRPYN